MRSHLTAFGIGAGLSLLAAGAFALFAPEIAHGDDDGEGVHIVNIGKGDNGSFHLKDEELNLSADWKGDFEFAADGRSLTALKGRLEIKLVENGKMRKAVFENKSGEIIADASIDDEKELVLAEANRAAADLLQLFARASGVNAGGRVSAILASGGKVAAIAEIGQLVGSHAVGAYIEELAKRSSLTNEDVLLLAERVKGLDSDYAKRNALSALLSAPSLGDGALAAIVDVATTIEGDHELRLIIEDIADRKVSEKTFSVATHLLDEIDGDHEVRLAVEALLESENISGVDAARAIDLAIKSIEGDYEIRLVAEAAGERLNDGDVAAATLRAIGAIEGAHERRLAIEEFAGSIEEESGQWLALVEAAKGVDGDHERRLVVETLYGEAPARDDIRAALRKIAESIGSDHERRLALEAIE